MDYCFHTEQLVIFTDWLNDNNVCTKTHGFLVDKIPPEEPEHLSWKCKKGWSVATFFKKNNRGGSCIARCEVKPKRSLSIKQVNPRPLVEQKLTVS